MLTVDGALSFDFSPLGAEFEEKGAPLTRPLQTEAVIMDTSYLTTQVTTIIGQLHSIFDEIGVPRNEREARETEVSPMRRSTTSMY